MKAIGAWKRIRYRYIIVIIALAAVVLCQQVPGWGEWYARTVYPQIAAPLSRLSGKVPFAVGDLFIGLSIAWVVIYPFYARLRRHKGGWKIVAREVEYLVWVYVWFYAAWGLNYSQADFYQRTHTPRAAYTAEDFRRFTDSYVAGLNASYTTFTAIDPEVLCREVVNGYNAIADRQGVHRPFDAQPRVKTMLFTPLASKVGVSGSMGPFFCEFTVNGEVPSHQYPATYAHELSHLLGIANEAEANFYAYQVCTRSSLSGIRFSGYFSILFHVLSNAARLMSEEEYKALLQSIRPEILDLARETQKYWQEKYSPLLGAIQDRMYELYLRGNKISSGQKNYSEVVGLLVAWQKNL